MTAVFMLQNAAAANGNGVPTYVAGFDTVQQLEVVESGGGTCTLTLEGSLDGTNWYSLGYYQVDANASLTRSVSALSVLASSKHVYQILDPYAQVRARMTSAAGGVVLTVRLFAV